MGQTNTWTERETLGLVRWQRKVKLEMTARKGKRGDDGKKGEKRRVLQERGKEESMARKGKRGEYGKKGEKRR